MTALATAPLPTAWTQPMPKSSKPKVNTRTVKLTEEAVERAEIIVQYISRGGPRVSILEYVSEVFINATRAEYQAAVEYLQEKAKRDKEAEATRKPKGGKGA